MLSMRSGWPREAILKLTRREAGWMLAEIDRLEDQRELRACEAFHSPSALRERIEDKREASAPDFAKLALHLAKTANLAPEKAHEIAVKQAAVDFLKRQKNGR